MNLDIVISNDSPSAQWMRKGTNTINLQVLPTDDRRGEKRPVCVTRIELLTRFKSHQ